MSNLGAYQVATTLAKKVGGMENLFGLTAGVGGLITAGVIFVGKAITDKIALSIENQEKSKRASIIYTVQVDGHSNEGLHFMVGEYFNVLDVAEDAVLIRKIGDSNNPYFVSEKFLKSISDF